MGISWVVIPQKLISMKENNMAHQTSLNLQNNTNKTYAPQGTKELKKLGHGKILISHGAEKYSYTNDVLKYK